MRMLNPMKISQYLEHTELDEKFQELIKSLADFTTEHLHPLNVIEEGDIDNFKEVQEEILKEGDEDSTDEDEVANRLQIEEDIALCIELKEIMQSWKINCIFYRLTEESEE